MCEKWWIKLYEQLWNGWNIEQRQQTPNSSPKLTCNTIFLAKRPKIQLPENNQIMVVLMKFHNLVFTTKFIRTSAIWTSIPESEKSLPFRIARRRYLRSGPCFFQFYVLVAFTPKFHMPLVSQMNLTDASGALCNAGVELRFEFINLVFPEPCKTSSFKLESCLVMFLFTILQDFWILLK